MHLKISSAKWWPFCAGGDELTYQVFVKDKCIHVWDHHGLFGTKPVPSHYLNQFWFSVKLKMKSEHGKIFIQENVFETTVSKYLPFCLGLDMEIQRELVTYICISLLNHHWLTDQQQAIIWTNAALLLMGSLGTKFAETFIKIKQFPCTEIHFKMQNVSPFVQPLMY